MRERVSRRLFAAIAVVVAALAMCMGAATPAFAANTAVNGGTTTFDKYLVMNSDANVPDVTFSFSVSQGSSQTADGTKPAIYAGIGTPTVTSAEFTPGDSTTEGTPTNGSASGKKYAVKEVTVDFRGITFTRPGIYRYIVTESPNSQDGITNDGTTSRTLDVWVKYVNGSDSDLEIAGYYLYAGTPSTNDDFANTAKSAGFENTYATKDLTLEKQVTGNQGDRDKYFEFNVSITGAVAGTVYDVNLSNADSNPNVNGDVKSNPGELVATGGSVSATYYLKDDQSITIQGLTEGTDYTITETAYDGDGYKTSYVIDTGSTTDGRTTGSQEMGTNSHKVVFTNNKEGTVPTGILLETGPYIAMGVVVVAGMIALFATSRRRVRE